MRFQLVIELESDCAAGSSNDARLTAHLLAGRMPPGPIAVSRERLRPLYGGGNCEKRRRLVLSRRNRLPVDRSRPVARLLQE
jgi:hypothetical protein